MSNCGAHGRESSILDETIVEMSQMHAIHDVVGLRHRECQRVVHAKASHLAVAWSVQCVVGLGLQAVACV